MIEGFAFGQQCQETTETELDLTDPVSLVLVTHYLPCNGGQIRGYSRVRPTRHCKHAQPRSVGESTLTDASQQVGPLLHNWVSPPTPRRTSLIGRWCAVESLNPDGHGSSLFCANTTENDGGLWTYLPYGPFKTEGEYLNWLQAASESDDPLYYAVVNRNTGASTGVASYLRMDTANGVIEVGHINFSPPMQRTAMGTEAMFLMMRNAFDLGYRRYEWKCDALNAKSCRAALRLGFRYEGTFRQAAIYKGRNRDTAWFAIIDKDWPRLRTAFEEWLNPSNFDGHGQQIRRLSELTAIDVAT